MRNRVFFVLAAMTITGVAACSQIWEVPDVERREIKPWLVCVDCTAGELNRAVARGSRAIRFLDAAIARGPTKADSSAAVRAAIDGVQRAQRYRKQHQGGLLSGPDSTETVNQQVDYFTLTYRLRAAQALYLIDSVKARLAVARFCTGNPPPADLHRRQEFRAQFKKVGDCP